MSDLSRKLINIIAAILLVLFVLYSPSFFSYRTHVSHFEELIAQNYGVNVKINGDVRLSTLPVPRVLLNQVSLIDETNDFQVMFGALELDLSLPSLITGKLKPSMIKMVDANLDYNEMQNFFDQNSSLKNNADLPKIAFDNLNISLVDSQYNFLFGGNIESASGSFTANTTLEKPWSVSANYQANGVKYAVDVSLESVEGDKIKDLNAKVHSDLFNLDIKGDIENFVQSPQFIGELDLQFNPLLAAQNIGEQKYQILQDDEYNLQSKLLVSDHGIRLKDLVMNSKSIKDAKGEVYYDLNNAINSQFKFIIPEVDLEELFNINSEFVAEKKSFFDIVNDIVSPILTSFDYKFSAESQGGLSLKVSQMNFNEKSIEDVNILAVFQDDKLIIKNFNAKLPGDGEIDLKAEVTHNGIRPKLSGQISQSINNFKEFANWLNLDISEELTSEDNTMSLVTYISLIPRNINFDRMKLSVGNLKMLGNINMRRNSDEPVEINANIRINELDLDHLKFTYEIDKLITTLYFYDSDKYGVLLGRYLDDYNVIRKYPLNTSIDLVLDKAIIKNQQFNNIKFSSKLAANKVEFDDIAIKDDDLDLTGKFIFSTSTIRPRVSLELDSKMMDCDKISGIFPSLDDLHKQYIKAINSSKGEGEGEGEQQQEYMQTFNFFSMHNFNVDFAINIKNIVESSNTLNSFALKGEINDGILKIEDTMIGVFRGLLQANGSVVILSQVPSFSFSFALNNFNPAAALNYLYGYDNFDGYMSISGAIAGNGVNFEEFKSRAYGTATVIGKKIDVKGIDIGEIIKTTELPISYNLKIEQLKYHSKNGETTFDDLKGDISFANGIAALDNFVFENNRSKGIMVSRVNFIDGVSSSKSKISFIPTGFNNVLTLNVDAQGEISKQQYQSNIDEILKFLQSTSGDYQKFLEEERERKSRSLIRNRRL